MTFAHTGWLIASPVTVTGCIVYLTEGSFVASAVVEFMDGNTSTKKNAEKL
jgi:hypothetical protein